MSHVCFGYCLLLQSSLKNKIWFFGGILRVFEGGLQKSVPRFPFAASTFAIRIALSPSLHHEKKHLGVIWPKGHLQPDIKPGPQSLHETGGKHHCRPRSPTTSRGKKDQIPAKVFESTKTKKGNKNHLEET